jgi:hypothetical protein
LGNIEKFSLLKIWDKVTIYQNPERQFQMTRHYEEFLQALNEEMKSQSALKLVADGLDKGCLRGEIQECHYLHETVGGTEFLQFFLLEPGEHMGESKGPTFVFRWAGNTWSVLPPAQPTELTAADLAELFVSMPAQWAAVAD